MKERSRFPLNQSGKRCLPWPAGGSDKERVPVRRPSNRKTCGRLVPAESDAEGPPSKPSRPSSESKSARTKRRRAPRRGISDAEEKPRRRNGTVKRPCRTFARRKKRGAPFARRRKTRGLRRATEKIPIWPDCDGGRKSRSTDRCILGLARCDAPDRIAAVPRAIERRGAAQHMGVAIRRAFCYGATVFLSRA